MVHGKKRIPYWIDRRVNRLAGPDYDATISFGLPIEPEDSQYGEYRVIFLCIVMIMKCVRFLRPCRLLRTLVCYMDIAAIRIMSAKIIAQAQTFRFHTSLAMTRKSGIT